jgi:hypothetical protein
LRNSRRAVKVDRPMMAGYCSACGSSRTAAIWQCWPWDHQRGPGTIHLPRGPFFISVLVSSAVPAGVVRIASSRVGAIPKDSGAREDVMNPLNLLAWNNRRLQRLTAKYACLSLKTATE